MAKTENEISLVWKVKGENELASAIRSIGNAIKSIDFDKLSEVTGVASILSTLQSNKFYFDVSTGTGIEKSIKQVNALLTQLNQVEAIRETLNKKYGLLGNYEALAQSAVSIPPEMTLPKLRSMQGTLTTKMRMTKDAEVIGELNNLREIIIAAKETVKSGLTEGKYIDSAIRQQVNVFKNFPELVNDALHKNFAKLKGISGLVGESIDETFRNMSTEARTRVINANKQEIAKTKAKLKIAEKEYEIFKTPETELEVEQLKAEINRLTNIKKQYEDALKILVKEERVARTREISKYTAPLSAKDFTSKVAEIKPGFISLSSEERERALNKILLERQEIQHNISTIKKQITDLNSLEGKAQLESLQKLTSELNLNKVKEAAIKEINNEEKKAQQERIAKERQSNKERIEQLKQEKAVRSEATKTAANEEKEILKALEEEEKNKKRIAELEEQDAIYKGKRVNLTTIIQQKEKILVENSELQKKIEEQLQALGKQRLDYLRYSATIEDYNRRIANAQTAEEREQLMLQRKQYIESSNQQFVTLKELQMQKQSNDLAMTRLNVLLKTGSAHKENIVAIVGHYLSLDRIVSRMSFVWTAMFSYGIMYKIQNGFREAQNSAMALNEQLQRMKSIMSDVERQSIPAIKRELLDLSKSFGLSIEELGNSMYEILSSNFNPEFAQKLLAGATKMATAGLSTLEEATSLLISSINAYGYSVDSINTLSDTFFEAIRVGRFTIGELGEDFAKASTIAAMFGIDIREVLTALATMTNQGLKTNEAITALNRLMMNFASGGSQEAKRVAKEFGIEMNSNAIKAKGLAGLVRDLNKATEEQIVALTGNVRAFKAMASVMTDPKRYEEFYKSISNAAGATERALKEVEESQAFRLKKYKQEFTVGMMDIAELVMPLLIEGQKLLVSISKLFGGMGAKMALTTVAAGILAIAVSKLIAKFTALSTSIAGSNTQLAASAIAMKAASKIAAPVAIVAGIASIAAAIWQLASNAKKAKKEMDELNKSIDETVKEYKEMYTAEEVEAKNKFDVSIVSIRAYIKEAKDETKTIERRTLALEAAKKELKTLTELYPAHFEKLDIEKLKLDDNLGYWGKYEEAITKTSKALLDHIKLLESSATLAAYQNTITKTQEKLNELDIEMSRINKDFIESFSNFNKIGVIPLSASTVWDKLIKYLTIANTYNINPFTYKGKSEPLISGALKNEESIAMIYKELEPLFAYLRSYKNNQLATHPIEKLLKELNNILKQKGIAEVKYDEAIRLLKKEGTAAAQQYLDMLASERPSIPTGGGETGRGETTEKYDYRAALKIIEDAYLKAYETVSVGLDYDKIREMERAKEQALFDQAVEIINKIEKPTERDEAMLNFIKWLYENRKERLTLILSNLKKKMDEASTAEVQSAIQKQMNDTINELLIAATQYQGFSLEEWKKKGATYKLPTTAGFQFGENRELQKILSAEDLRIIESFSMSPSTYKFYEKLVKDLEEQNKKYNLRELINNWIKAKNDNDTVTQESISLEITKIAEREKKLKLDLLNLAELLKSEAGLSPDDLKEMNARIDLLGSGMWAAQLEYIVEAKTNVETTMERLDREYKSYNKKNIEIIKEWINSRLLSIEEIRKEANVLNTKFENLTIKEIDNLLLKPLPEDVKSVLEERKRELESYYKLLKNAQQEELQRLRENQRKYYRDIENLIRDAEGTTNLSLGFLKLIFSPLKGEMDARDELREKRKQAKETKRRSELPAGRPDKIYLSAEEEKENEEKLEEYNLEFSANQLADLRNIVDQMKTVWDEYYDYLKEKISDWYNNEVKKIDDRARQEHRSALWSEKQKEKLDKEREKKERQLMKFKRAVSIAEIAYNTAVAVMRIFKDFSIPISYVLAGIVSSLGLAQIALVNKQKFAKGGKVYGASHSAGGVPVELEGGEFVMSKKAAEGNEAILYIVQRMLEGKREMIKPDRVIVDKLNELTNAVRKIDIAVEFKGQVLNEVDLYKKTVKGQRLARVM